MKNVVMVLVTGMLGLLTMLIVMTITGKMNRSMEIQTQVPAAMEMTMEQTAAQAQPYAHGEVVAECIESMAAAVDTNSDLTVEVYEEDAAKGLLALRVREEFRHPNGAAGSTECERVVIYNCLEEPSVENYRVCFYTSKTEQQAGKQGYKICVVRSGEKVLPPEPPVVEGSIFVGWKDIGDYIADFSLPVEQDLVYYAEWE